MKRKRHLIEPQARINGVYVRARTYCGRTPREGDVHYGIAKAEVAARTAEWVDWCVPCRNAIPRSPAAGDLSWP